MVGIFGMKSRATIATTCIAMPAAKAPTWLIPMPLIALLQSMAGMIVLAE
jgi:hypothetical protein